jgi:hypothetical protein
MTLCLSGRSLWAQYHVDDDSMTIDERSGTLSENSLISSSVFSSLPRRRRLPPTSMTANWEYFLWRSSPTNNVRSGSPLRLIRVLLTPMTNFSYLSPSVLVHDPPAQKPWFAHTYTPTKEQYACAPRLPQSYERPCKQRCCKQSSEQSGALVCLIMMRYTALQDRSTAACS